MDRAAQLDLAELLAMQPRRSGGPLVPGQRIPGGERRGVVRAQGSDFDSISPYAPGDDVRRIDWRSTARSGKTQMRRVAASAHRARCVVLGLSDDHFFGTSGQVMAKTAALTAALKCWEALALNEPVGLALGVEPELAMPRRGQRQVERLLEALWRRYCDLGEGRETRRIVPLEALIFEAAGRLRRRDELCVIDEFATMNPAFCNMSSALAEQRALQAFVLEDPMCLQLLPAGEYAFHAGWDTRESRLKLDEKVARKSYEDLQGLRKARRDALLACGWEVTNAIDILPAPANAREASQ